MVDGVNERPLVCNSQDTTSLLTRAEQTGEFWRSVIRRPEMSATRDEAFFAVFERQTGFVVLVWGVEET